MRSGRRPRPTTSVRPSCLNEKKPTSAPASSSTAAFLCSRAAGRQMIEQSGGRRDPERDRELRLDGQAPARRTRPLPRPASWRSPRPWPSNGPSTGSASTASVRGQRTPRARVRPLADRGGPRPRRRHGPARDACRAPEEIAVWAAALCSPYADYITGENLTIDGGHWLEQGPTCRPWGSSRPASGRGDVSLQADGTGGCRGCRALALSRALLVLRLGGRRRRPGRAPQRRSARRGLLCSRGRGGRTRGLLLVQARRANARRRPRSPA